MLNKSTSAFNNLKTIGKYGQGVNNIFSGLSEIGQGRTGGERIQSAIKLAMEIAKLFA